MTDHRATDLSYGHFGEATYDIETGEWRFSVEPSAQNFRQLLPLRSVIAPSNHTPSPTVDEAKKRTKSTKALVKSYPETFPADVVLSSLIRLQPAAHSRPHVGQLLAVGQAVDAEQRFGSRKTTIIATSCGEAGHVLRLIKPGVERHEWGRQSSARLSCLDARSSDRGYWVGLGGRILQVTYAENGKLPTTWLAVRQDNLTTIFRPMYGAITTPAVVPSGHSNTYPASRLNANPVAVLSVERSGSHGHADVSFNPWYTRQFAVVDHLGSWSIWDIEGGHTKNSATRLVQGKRANIFDGYVPDITLKAPDNADGWHKILWASTVSTIVVCNRRHVAVFDAKAAPIRLPSKDFFTGSNSDWILDVKRSPSNLCHLFLLTSSRIFWLEVMPGEERDGNTSLRVLLSYRHFRDANDGSMRLSLLKGDDGRIHATNLGTPLTEAVSAAIYSEKTYLVNIYTFSPDLDGLGPTSCQGSLNLSKTLNNQDGMQNFLQSLDFLETSLKAIPTRPQGPEHRYIEEDIKFFQLLAMGPDLGLHSGLCTMQLSYQSSDSSVVQIEVPTRTYVYTLGSMSSKRAVVEPWIIPDGQVDEENRDSSNHSLRLSKRLGTREEATDQRLAINFRPIYEQAFPASGQVEATDSVESMNELLENALDRIRQGKQQNDDLAITTLLDLSQFLGLSVDLEHGAPILRAFLDSLTEDEEPDAPSTLVLSDLTLCPGISFQTLQDSTLPDLLKVYDQVADNWIANLPHRVPGLTRLAKFKIARKVALELCLSSIGVSLCNKASEVPAILTEGTAQPALINKSATSSRAGSPALLSSQARASSLPKSSFGLPTPAQTPSLYSQSHASASEYAEDSAISRLRQYAVSIKSKPDLGSSRILSQWPSTPGVNPATFSYEAIQRKAAAEESGEEDSQRKRRDDARRKKRTDRFLSRESTIVAEPSSSQPAFMPFGGSQSDAAQHTYSSQTVVEDVPMTQPDRGVFGSRTTQKKKPKKKRAAGFR